MVCIICFDLFNLMRYLKIPAKKATFAKTNSSVRLGWSEIQGASRTWVHSKAIELTLSTQMVRDPRRFMALGNRSHPFNSMPSAVCAN